MHARGIGSPFVRAPWNGAFLDELCAFPFGGHDDQVDALSGAFEQLVANTRQRARVTKARIVNR